MASPTPEPSELIYVPAPSWAPAVVALGLGGLAMGVFTAWYWPVIGLGILLLGLRAWWRLSDDEVSRMRRAQATDTAVIPAEPIRPR